MSAGAGGDRSGQAGGFPSGGFRVLGTAGHVDHGKTALVKALTGIDTTHLPEEREREITIQPGYAYMRMPSGRTLGIVDVPGHERLVKNMLAGACGIDVVLLVVAADEGIMPQTVEHLQILQLLGVPDGVIALTKCDLVPGDRVSQVRQQVRRLVAGTFLAGAAILPTSAVTGEGLDALRAEIQRLADGPGRRARGLVGTRMPIDRVFTLAGHGTVVTGTLFSGTISQGQHIAVLPAGLEARVRSLQVHGQPVSVAECGQRTAVNLAGVSVQDVRRGDVLCDPSVCQVTTAFDAQLLLGEAGCVWQRPGAVETVRVHIAASDVVGRVAALYPAAEAHPASLLARVLVDEPVVVQVKDRFVIRSLSPPRTIGGGQVLNPCPPRRRDVDRGYLLALARAAPWALSASREESPAAVEGPGPTGGDRERGMPDDGERLAWLLRAVLRSLGCVLEPRAETLSGLMRSTSDEVEAARARLVRAPHPEGHPGADVLTVSLASGGSGRRSVWVDAAFYREACARLLSFLADSETAHPESPGVTRAQLVSGIRLPRFGPGNPTGARPGRPATVRMARSGFDLLAPTREQVVAAVVELAQAEGKVRVTGDLIASPGHHPGLTGERGMLAAYIERRLAEGGLSPPAAAAIAQDAITAVPGLDPRGLQDELAAALTYLTGTGRVVRVGEGLYLSRPWFEEGCRRILDMIRSRDRLTVSDVREGVGTSRRFALGLLDATDRLGYTRRVGDVRVKGMRARESEEGG